MGFRVEISLRENVRGWIFVIYKEPTMKKAVKAVVFAGYFCCPGCEDAFKADPEKYMSKLPQFKK